jgi:hypothetical protein
VGGLCTYSLYLTWSNEVAKPPKEPTPIYLNNFPELSGTLGFMDKDKTPEEIKAEELYEQADELLAQSGVSSRINGEAARVSIHEYEIIDDVKNRTLYARLARYGKKGQQTYPTMIVFGDSLSSEDIRTDNPLALTFDYGVDGITLSTLRDEEPVINDPHYLDLAETIIDHLQTSGKEIEQKTAAIEEVMENEKRTRRKVPKRLIFLGAAATTATAAISVAMLFGQQDGSKAIQENESAPSSASEPSAQQDQQPSPAPSSNSEQAPTDSQCVVGAGFSTGMAGGSECFLPPDQPGAPWRMIQRVSILGISVVEPPVDMPDGWTPSQP